MHRPVSCGHDGGERPGAEHEREDSRVDQREDSCVDQREDSCVDLGPFSSGRSRLVDPASRGPMATGRRMYE